MIFREGEHSYKNVRKSLASRLNYSLTHSNIPKSFTKSDICIHSRHFGACTTCFCPRRLSNEKRKSTLSTAKKVGQKLASEYQTNGVTGQSNTCEVSGIDMSKTYKVNNKLEQPIKKTGARRSLAANLSHR